MTERKFIATIGLLMLAGFKGVIPALINGKSLTPAGEFWYKALGNIPDEILTAVVEDVCLNEEFFPAIATINRYAQKYLSAGETDGQEAWGMYLAERSRICGYNDPTAFENNPVMREVIRQMGGFSALGQSLEKDTHILRAQMRDIYNSVKARMKTQERVRALEATSPVKEIEFMRSWEIAND